MDCHMFDSDSNNAEICTQQIWQIWFEKKKKKNQTSQLFTIFFFFLIPRICSMTFISSHLLIHSEEVCKMWIWADIFINENIKKIKINILQIHAKKQKREVNCTQDRDSVAL